MDYAGAGGGETGNRPRGTLVVVALTVVSSYCCLCYYHYRLPPIAIMKH